MNKAECQMELKGKVEEKIQIYSLALLELNGKQISGSEAQAIEPWNMEDGTVRSSPTELQLKELVRETEAQLVSVLGSRDAATKALDSWRQAAKTAIIQGIDKIDETKNREQARIVVDLIDKRTEFTDQLSRIHQTISGPMRKHRSSLERYHHAKKRKTQIANLIAFNKDVFDLCKKLGDQESTRNDCMKSPPSRKRGRESDPASRLVEDTVEHESDKRPRRRQPIFRYV